MKQIVGSSYRQLKSFVNKYAQEDYPVLFAGKTGCGKELFARYYMRSSKRQGEIRTVNCPAFTENLLEAEVFGSVRGAFTGAFRDRNGLIETCRNGILFLDELGEASEHFQAAILRVSEGNTYKKVGSDEEQRSDALIIAATNSIGGIRMDLKKRFHILPIPPLQKIDIPALAKHFLGRPLKEAVLEELMARDYSGNVRELKKCCEKLKVERGNEIFSNKASDSFSIFEVDTFDYERYRQELETWYKYLQPIVDKYDFKEFKYKYFQWDETWLTKDIEKMTINRCKSKYSLHDKVVVNYSSEDDSSDMPTEDYIPGTLKLIKWILDGIEKQPFSLLTDYDPETKEDFLTSGKILAVFRSHLRRYYDTGMLPHLLDQLGKGHNFANVLLMGDKPPLYPILETTPPDTAVKQFRKAYLSYHLRNHSGNREETAKTLGIPKRTLDSQIRRLRK